MSQANRRSIGISWRNEGARAHENIDRQRYPQKE